ncbi:MAG: S8 family serine peptidase [Planctomycetes bacterium]|nr:S8 family serine peptidase [Planctomycetota bacterium]
MIAPEATSQTVEPAGPKRWLVQLESRSFDLRKLRQALIDHRSDEALGLVASFERRIRRDHAEFSRLVDSVGGKVLRHWWLVDACHVEASEAGIQELSQHPSVVRVERDLLVAAHSGRALDHFNHGAISGFSMGWDGSSPANTVIAIMDSGIDSDMDGTGRPHRAFFRDGDPTTVTPGGLAGSRIVLNQAFGALPADDAHGHGTRAAAIAAGAAWGTATATDGHAPGARIASYGIADSIGPTGGVFALYSTMTTAWQQMVVDKATYDIVVANNSFGGEQDPLHTVQQALDAAAWTADILICVSAGNDGSAPQTGGQSAVNGLAVAAVNEDEHRVYEFSSRGPVVGDPTRTYPDIAAIAWGRTPIQDCEGVDDLFGLTSSAAPRVAGAAMAVRSAVPALRVDEAKAILLASALDLADENPGLDRNAFGVGLMRQDRALLTATDAAKHATDTIQAGATRSFSFAAPPGEELGVAVAWLRDVTTTTAWSDLSLRIADSATNQTLATSNLPRNPYELVRFSGAPSGTAVAEVTAISIAGPQQEFAIAIASLPSLDPFRGSFRVHGAGCGGPVVNGDGVCVGANVQATGTDLFRAIDGVPFSNRYANAIELVAPPTGMTLTGFELLVRSLGDTALTTTVHLDDGTGQPATGPVRFASMPTNDVERWCRTTFAPVTLAPNERFFLGIAGWSKSQIELRPGRAAETVRVFWRDRCGDPAWDGWFFDRVGIRALCAELPVHDVARHTTVGDIELGHAASMRCEGLAPNAPVILMLGFSDSIWAGLPLPLDLSQFGGTGCQIHLAPRMTVGTGSDGAGTAFVNVQFGSGTGLLGVHVFSQYIVLDASSSRMITLSNSGENIIGTW